MGKTVFRYCRLFLWGLKILVVRHFKIIFAILFGGVIFLFYLSHLKFSLPRRPRTLEIGLVGNFDSPTKLPFEVSRLLSSGLTKITPEGEATPSLASKWVVENEGLVYTLFINKEQKWVDGTKIEVDDLNFDLPEVEVKKESEDKVKFLLKNPFSPFPTLVSRPLFKGESFIGLGPCKVEGVKKEEGIIKYLGVSCKGLDFPSLGFRFYPREEVALTALKLGEIQVLADIKEIEPVANWPNFNFYLSPFYERQVVLFYNTGNSFLSEKMVRQALTWALPREGFEFASFGPISPKSWAFFEDIKKYTYDPEKARQLLAKVIPPSSLTISTVSVYQDLAKIIADSWEKLGIKTLVKVKTTVEETLGDFQVLLIGQEVPLDPDQYSLWHSTQEGNITGLVSPKIDKLLEDGRKTLEREKRREIYLDFQKYLIEECPAAFLYYPKQVTVIAKKVDSKKLREFLGLKEE